jgi:hypothetical protein
MRADARTGLVHALAGNRIATGITGMLFKPG